MVNLHGIYQIEDQIVLFAGQSQCFSIAAIKSCGLHGCMHSMVVVCTEMGEDNESDN